jgi:hypothetical protein
MRKIKIRAHCPHCFRNLICANAVDNIRPYSGDYAICSACGEFAVFEFSRRAQVLRVPSPRERVEIAKSASANAARARWSQRERREVARH